MRDILVRLSYVNPLCTCLTKTPEVQYHGELCIYRVVRDAEAEILRLRTSVETIASHPSIKCADIP